MPRWPISEQELRDMYRGGVGNADARWWASFWGRIQRWGVMPRRWVTLEVPGRRTGKPMSVPIGLADVAGRWYAVSMLGECNWVRNVRANDGRCVLHRAGAHPCRLVEVSPERSAPILSRYVDTVPGGRPHIPVQRGAPLDEFAAVAAQFPVFEIHDDTGARPWRPSRSWLLLALVCLAVAGGATRRAFGGGAHRRG